MAATPSFPPSTSTTPNPSTLPSPLGVVVQYVRACTEGRARYNYWYDTIEDAMGATGTLPIMQQLLLQMEPAVIVLLERNIGTEGGRPTGKVDSLLSQWRAKKFTPDSLNRELPDKGSKLRRLAQEAIRYGHLETLDKKLEAIDITPIQNTLVSAYIRYGYAARAIKAIEIISADEENKWKAVWYKQWHAEAYQAGNTEVVTYLETKTGLTSEDLNPAILIELGYIDILRKQGHLADTDYLEIAIFQDALEVFVAMLEVCYPSDEGLEPEKLLIEALSNKACKICRYLMGRFPEVRMRDLFTDESGKEEGESYVTLYDILNGGEAEIIELVFAALLKNNAFADIVA